MKTRSAETLALDTAQQKKVAKQTKRVKKQLEEGTLIIEESRKEAKQRVEETRGLIYIGHIPHGFYEDEMRQYFKEFGKVTNVKVCRSRKTGNSKGYGYVEFSDPEVAKIAADTMNNYLMFKKRIVTEYVPYEKRPKHLFHGKSSNVSHTSVKSRRGKEKHSKNKVLDTETLAKKNLNTLRKLKSKIKKLKDLGIQCKVSPIGSVDKNINVNIKKSSNLLIQKFEARLSNQESEDSFTLALKKTRKSRNSLKTSSLDLSDNNSKDSLALPKVKKSRTRNSSNSSGLLDKDSKDSITLALKKIKSRNSSEKSILDLSNKNSKDSLNITKSKINNIKNALEKSVLNRKSKHAKSLDSIKTLMSSKKALNQIDEVTQTIPIIELKSKAKLTKNSGVKKAKTAKKENKLQLNSETVRRIARELIRKKGNPLVNVISNKNNSSTAKKSLKKSKK